MLPAPGAVNEARVSEYQDERFEWDEAKAARTYRDRGVSFYDMKAAFAALAIERPDRRRDYGEERFTLIGPVNGRLFVIAFTWRGRRRRLISARKANAREAQFYDRST